MPRRGRPVRLGNEIGRATDRHQVRGAMPADRLDRGRAAFRLAHHREQAGTLEHQVRELVHAGRGGRTRRSHHLVPHGVHRSDVVDDAVRKIDTLRQARARGKEVCDALVRGVASREHPAAQEQRLARLPARDLLAGQRIEIDATRRRACAPGHPRPLPRAAADRAQPAPVPSSTKCACRVAAQFGIIATGFEAAWVG